jgi:hypothetical protein
MEFIMPKRDFYAGENIEARLLIDNINDERIANDVGSFIYKIKGKAFQIQYNVVERTTKPDVDDEDALKHPARVIKSAKVDGTNVERNRNQVTIGSLVIPSAAPASLPNAVGGFHSLQSNKYNLSSCFSALASLPKDKTSPQLSPDDQASKLFEHPSVISHSRKEPIFKVHYSLQVYHKSND